MATTTMLPRGAHAADPLWAQAAELERQFEGYKRRLAERREAAAVAAVSDRRHPDGDDGAGEKEEDEDVEVGRGRRYEAYVRRRDEKLRQGWLARMERKEAEVKALWARLDGGRHRPGDDLGGLAATASPAREVTNHVTQTQRIVFHRVELISFSLSPARACSKNKRLENCSPFSVQRIKNRRSSSIFPRDMRPCRFSLSAGARIRNVQNPLPFPPKR